MKKVAKVSGVVCLASLFVLAPGAMAVVIKGAYPTMGQFSEVAAMLLLGASLIGMVGFLRRNISRHL